MCVCVCVCARVCARVREVRMDLRRRTKLARESLTSFGSSEFFELKLTFRSSRFDSQGGAFGLLAGPN